MLNDPSLTPWRELIHFTNEAPHAQGPLNNQLRGGATANCRYAPTKCK